MVNEIDSDGDAINVTIHIVASELVAKMVVDTAGDRLGIVAAVVDKDSHNPEPKLTRASSHVQGS
jgi:hypothetical protein